MMISPTEIMDRLKGLPPHLAATERRFWVEAVSDETKAPMIEYYRQEAEASAAAQAWAKGVGAEGFYPPRGGSVQVFSFKTENAPTSPAWTNAGRGYVSRRGYVAKYPSKRPAGKALTKELEALPAFPRYSAAMDHLGAITDLRTEKGLGGVGHSDGKFHYSVPFEIDGRYFINAVNHNYDILRQATQAAEYLAGDHPEYASSLDFKDDPIGWRPGPGWAFITKVEVEFLIAEENMRRAAARKLEAA